MAFKIVIVLIIVLLCFINVALCAIDDKLYKIMKVYDIDKLYFLKTPYKERDILGEEIDE